MNKALLLPICYVFLIGLGGSASAATNVGSCRVITSPGVYVLNANISSTTTCMMIESSDVIFDGAGYNIIGSGNSTDYGIYVHNSTNHLNNVTVKNLVVTDWKTGIYYWNAQNGSIINNTANSNRYYGIYLYSSSDNSLSNNNASDNYYGIYLYSSSDNSLSNNNASDNWYGIRLWSSGYNSLTNNTASRNDYGIRLWSSSYNTLTGNTVLYNYGDMGEGTGIYLFSSPSNTLTYNTANFNIDMGIALWNSNYNTLVNNNANSNNRRGFWLGFSSSNNLTNNTANSNKYGIRLESSSYNTLLSNNLSNNRWDFYSSGSSYNKIISNPFTDTKASFTYSGDITVNSSSSPAGDPLGYTNLGKYLSITNTTLTWVYLNISYVDADLGAVNESTLRMYRYNASWNDISGTNGVDILNNYVYANLTTFGVFAPMGADNTRSDRVVTSPHKKRHCRQHIRRQYGGIRTRRH